jgi:hypothetical protein
MTPKTTKSSVKRTNGAQIERTVRLTPLTLRIPIGSASVLSIFTLR